MREVDLFTDGACSGNPGPGGWAYILKDRSNGREKRQAGAEPQTTNNRMELLSVIRGLESLERPCAVRLVTDSNYVVKGASEWLAGWKANGWRRREKKKLVPIKNAELWQRLDELMGKHRVTCEWIKGHAGHRENEECDQMAVAAYLDLLGGMPPLDAGASDDLWNEEPTVPEEAQDARPGDGPPWIGFSQRVAFSGPAPISYLMEQGVANPGIISLAAGLVDQESLPVDETREVIATILSEHARARAALQYGTSDGSRALRDKLAGHLAELDGVAPADLGLTADRLIVGTGSQQLLYLVAETLLDPGDIVLVGVPGYFVFMGALESFGAKLVGVETDNEGLVLEALDQKLSELDRAGLLDRVKLLYDVTYFNNPTGLSLSRSRREKLVEMLDRWSRRQRIFLLEDAAYRELRYWGEDLPSLLRYDPEGTTVLYAGTFSKPFAPGLKTGYIVVPAALRAPLMQQKGHHDFGSANFSQAVLEAALASGHYKLHLEKLREVYRKKCKVMLEALRREFADLTDQVHWTEPEGGLYVWVQLPKGMDARKDSELFRRCLKEGVLYVPGEFCYPRDFAQIPSHCLRLSFGHVPVERIEEGTRRLARAVREGLGAPP